MSSYWRRRNARPYVSTSTASDRTGSATDGRHDVSIHPPVVVSGAHRLSQGTLVRARVLARLLGIRLLRLDADIVLVPADFGSWAHVHQHVDPRLRLVASYALQARTAGLDDATKLLARAARTLEESR